MSIANVVVGQAIRPGLTFLTLGNRKISSCLSNKGVKCMGLRRSTWLLFGICTFTTGTCTFSGSPVLAQEVTRKSASIRSNSSSAVITSSHGKEVIKDYSVIGIPGDGRCLFRAVAHGAQIRKGKGAPNETLQRECADELREKVVNELVKRRAETEWFIEGDFDTYTKRMRQLHVWGGEPELLMASHVLRMPITVYMFDKRSRGLISIAEYGQEYSKETPEPITVLYHGFGHYDALQLRKV